MGDFPMQQFRFIQRTGNTLMVRVTGFPQKNFHISRIDEAISHRDSLCCEAGLDPNKPFTYKNSRTHTKPYASKSNGLPIGIGIGYTKREPANGGTKVYTCIRAGVTILGKTTYKSFSVDRLGYEVALKMAIDWREQQLEQKKSQLTDRQRQRLQIAGCKEGFNIKNDSL